MNQVSVRKAAGGQAVETKTPIPVSEDINSFENTRGNVEAFARDHISGVITPGEPEAGVPGAATSPASIPIRTLSPEEEHAFLSQARRQGTPAHPRLLAYSLEGGVDALFIATHLNTSFNSASAPSLHWDDSILPHADGFHGTVSLDFPEDDARLELSGGHFSNTWQNHAQTSGNIHVEESASVSGTWLTGAMSVYSPAGWAFAKLGTGVLAYALDTHLKTDAASYEYSGLSGERWVGLLGIGAGLSTPWRFPLKANVSGMWWFTHDQDPPIESGVGQVSASLQFQF